MVLKEIEETKSEKVKEKLTIIQVVAQLPTQEVRFKEFEDKIINFITIEEYLTIQANNNVGSK